jgi:hypothetical protein
LNLLIIEKKLDIVVGDTCALFLLGSWSSGNFCIIVVSSFKKYPGKQSGQIQHVFA